MIPQWIHQTCKSKHLSNDTHTVCHTWIQKHPDFRYTLYDDHDITRFLNRYFNARVCNTFARIVNGSLKADFFRYCVLYVHGGVYVDIDISCVVPLTSAGIVDFDTDELVTASDYQERDTQPPNRDYRRDTVYQAFLCAKPHHPFMQYMINYMCHVMSHDLYRYDIFRIGGPQAFADRFDEYTQNTLTLREANNPWLSAKETPANCRIKVVSHLHECEYLGINKVVFAKCQHSVSAATTPHYHRDFAHFALTGFYTPTKLTSTGSTASCSTTASSTSPSSNTSTTTSTSTNTSTTTSTSTNTSTTTSTSTNTSANTFSSASASASGFNSSACSSASYSASSHFSGCNMV
eukprot:693256-Prorocentrum_minimum.AAC.36